jgi:DNA-binding transcriptional regulator YiaG
MIDGQLPSVFDQIMGGLESAIAQVRGQESLKVTEFPSPPPEAAPQTVVEIRKRLNMTQSVFAATLNVSTKTVQGWEQGTRAPGQASLRMLQILSADPGIVELLFTDHKLARTSSR